MDLRFVLNNNTNIDFKFRKEHFTMRKKFSALIISSMIFQQASTPNLGYEVAQTSGVESSSLGRNYIDKNIERQELHDLHIEFSPHDPLAISTSWLDPNTNTLIFSDSVNPISGSVSTADQDRIVQELLSESPFIDVSDLNFTKAQFITFIRELQANDKRLFNVSEELTFTYNSEKIIQSWLAKYDRHLTDNYNYYLKMLEDEIAYAVSLTEAGTTVVDKLLILNGYMATNFEYDSIGLNANVEVRDKVRFIETGWGVCESYTDVAKLILNELGIENITVSSDNLNHIWNMVKVDEEWYNIDFTWADPIANLIGRVDYDNFLISSARKIANNNKPDDWTSTVTPKATSTKYQDKFTITEVPFGFVNQKCYVMDTLSDQSDEPVETRTAGKIDTIDTATGVKTDINAHVLKDIRWYAPNGTSYYLDKYTGFGVFNNELYYNTPTAIMKYNTDGTISNVKDLSADLADSHEIWQMNLRGNQIECLIKEDIQNKDFSTIIVTIPSEDGSVNKEALEKLILLVENSIATVDISTNGADVNPTRNWVTQAEVTKINEALTAAKNASTQAEVDSEHTNLDKAMILFNRAKVAGKAKADKVALEKYIATLTELLNNTKISSNGSDIPTSEYWVTQSRHDMLKTDLEVAQQVVNNTSATQAIVDDTIFDLSNSQLNFYSNRKPGTAPAEANKQELAAALIIAKTKLQETTKSANGLEIEVASRWVTESEYTNFNAVILKADGIYNKSDATQTEVDDMKTELETAGTTLDGLKKVGLKELSEAITSATEMKATATSSEDGLNTGQNDRWVATDIYNALESKLTEATNFQNNPSPSTEQITIENATNALTEAKNNFNAAKKVGLKELSEAINSATEMKATATSSEDGLTIGQSDRWVLPAIYTALETKISEANTIIATPSQDQATVENATNALTEAKNNFNAAKKVGLKELSNNVESANTKILEASASADGSDIALELKWVPTNIYETLQTKLTEAQELIDNPIADQTIVVDTKTALVNAIDEFEANKKVGMQELSEAIIAADSMITTAVSSADGSDVEPSQQWVPTATYDALQNKLAEAKELKTNTSNDKSAVQTLTADLVSATTTFEGAKQPGTATINKEELTQALAVANENLVSVEINTDSANVAQGKKWVTQEVYTTYMLYFPNILTSSMSNCNNNTH